MADAASGARWSPDERARVGVHFQAYRDALQKRVREEEQRLASGARDDACRWRVRELCAAVRRAEHLAHALDDRGAAAQLAAMHDTVESLASVGA